jgi:cytochrome b6-f complex iron-sulfur subunit
MERGEFIKTCCLGFAGTQVMAFLLEGCASSNYYAKNSFEAGKAIISKNEFIISPDKGNEYRKFVLLKLQQFNYPLYLFRSKDDVYSAVLMECTHKSCELVPQGNFLVCPCHGSEFTATGKVQNPPAEMNLKSFTITTDAENIYLHF